jgi:hypothetical protein
VFFTSWKQGTSSDAGFGEKYIVFINWRLCKNSFKNKLILVTYFPWVRLLFSNLQFMSFMIPWTVNLLHEKQWVDLKKNYMKNWQWEFFLGKNKQTYLFIREVRVGLIAGSDYMYILSHCGLENILFFQQLWIKPISKISGVK